MKAVVMYDSIFGNTAQIAQAIAHTLGKHGAVQLIPVEQAHVQLLDQVTVLVLGCPTQYHDLPPATGLLLDHVLSGEVDGLPVAVFDTRYVLPVDLAGSAARVLARKLRKMGASLLLPPESFFVVAREGPLLGGERERAMHWAEGVSKKLEVSPHRAGMTCCVAGSA